MEPSEAELNAIFKKSFDFLVLNLRAIIKESGFDDSLLTILEGEYEVKIRGTQKEVFLYLSILGYSFTGALKVLGKISLDANSSDPEVIRVKSRQRSELSELSIALKNEINRETPNLIKKNLIWAKIRHYLQDTKYLAINDNNCHKITDKFIHRDDEETVNVNGSQTVSIPPSLSPEQIADFKRLNPNIEFKLRSDEASDVLPLQKWDDPESDLDIEQ